MMKLYREGIHQDVDASAIKMVEATPADAVEAFGGQVVVWCEEHGSGKVAGVSNACDYRLRAGLQSVDGTISIAGECRMERRYLLDAERREGER